MKSLQKYYWWVALPICWGLALWLVWRFSPIMSDGGGIAGSLYWSKKPPMADTSAELVQFKFIAPYLITATAVTLMFLATVAVMKRFGPKASFVLFWASTALSTALLLAIAGVSDSGTHLHLWNGPLMILTPHCGRF